MTLPYDLSASSALRYDLGLHLQTKLLSIYYLQNNKKNNKKNKNMKVNKPAEERDDENHVPETDARNANAEMHQKFWKEGRMRIRSGSSHASTTQQPNSNQRTKQKSHRRQGTIRSQTAAAAPPTQLHLHPSIVVIPRSRRTE